jgi:cytochrome c oxidase cbb3-type subunit II
MFGFLKDHGKIERNVFLMIVLIIIVTSIGAIVEIFPLFIKEVAIEKVEGMRPYTPLELAGFEIYKREGCYGCHSQQIRALRDEVERYGHYSLAAESMYDYPFMWGSKRTGPDLARVGGKYSDDWHVEHLINPRSLIPESIMPKYRFLHERKLPDLDLIQARMSVLKMLGTPYTDEDIKQFEQDIMIQLAFDTDTAKVGDFNKRYPRTFIRKFNRKTDEITEMDALVAYLQSLGNKVDLKTNKGRDW